MAKLAQIDVEILVAWWVPVYVQTLAFFCVLFGCAPDLRKISQFIVRHGMRIRIFGRTYRARDWLSAK